MIDDAANLAHALGHGDSFALVPVRTWLKPVPWLAAKGWQPGSTRLCDYLRAKKAVDDTAAVPWLLRLVGQRPYCLTARLLLPDPIRPAAANQLFL